MRSWWWAALLITAGCIQDTASDEMDASSLEAGDGIQLDQRLSMDLEHVLYINGEEVFRTSDHDADGPLPWSDGYLVSSQLSDGEATFLFGSGHSLFVLRQSDLARLDFDLGIETPCFDCDPEISHFNARPGIQPGLVKFPLAVGDTWQHTIPGVGAGEATAMAMEEITTPEGSFDAVHIVHEITATDTLMDLPPGEYEHDVDWTIDAWYAHEPGVVAASNYVRSETVTTEAEYRGHQLRLETTLTSTIDTELVRTYSVEQDDLDEAGVAKWLSDVNPRTTTTSFRVEVEADFDLDAVIDAYEAGIPATPDESAPLLLMPEEAIAGEPITILSDGDAQLTATLHGDIIGSGPGRLDVTAHHVGHVVVEALRGNFSSAGTIPVSAPVAGNIDCDIVAVSEVAECTAWEFDSLKAGAVRLDVSTQGVPVLGGEVILTTHEGTAASEGDTLEASVSIPSEATWAAQLDGIVLNGGATLEGVLLPGPEPAISPATGPMTLRLDHDGLVLWAAGLGSPQ